MTCVNSTKFKLEFEILSLNGFSWCKENNMEFNRGCLNKFKDNVVKVLEECYIGV